MWTTIVVALATVPNSTVTSDQSSVCDFSTDETGCGDGQYCRREEDCVDCTLCYYYDVKDGCNKTNREQHQPFIMVDGTLTKSTCDAVCSPPSSSLTCLNDPGNITASTVARTESPTVVIEQNTTASDDTTSVAITTGAAAGGVLVAGGIGYVLYMARSASTGLSESLL